MWWRVDNRMRLINEDLEDARYEETSKSRDDRLRESKDLREKARGLGKDRQ